MVLFGVRGCLLLGLQLGSEVVDFVLQFECLGFEYLQFFLGSGEFRNECL